MGKGCPSMVDLDEWSWLRSGGRDDQACWATTVCSFPHFHMPTPLRPSALALARADLPRLPASQHRRQSHLPISPSLTQPPACCVPSSDNSHFNHSSALYKTNQTSATCTHPFICLFILDPSIQSCDPSAPLRAQITLLVIKQPACSLWLLSIIAI